MHNCSDLIIYTSTEDFPPLKAIFIVKLSFELHLKLIFELHSELTFGLFFKKFSELFFELFFKLQKKKITTIASKGSKQERVKSRTDLQ